MELKKQIEEYYDFDEFVEYFREKYNIDLINFTSKKDKNSNGSLYDFLMFKKHAKRDVIIYASDFWPYNPNEEELGLKKYLNI